MCVQKHHVIADVGTLVGMNLGILPQLTNEEQERLKFELEVLEENVYQQKDDANAVEQFKRLVAKYLDVPELTPTIANGYIQKIIIHAPEKDK